MSRIHCKPYFKKGNDAGFTLVELLVVMAIGAIVMVGLMTTFTTQHKSYLVQDDVVEMQQSLRIAMDMIAGDIRTAGYDPGGASGAGIVTATAGRLGFTQDLNGNGVTTDTKEEITYGFATAEDGNFDGTPDAGPRDLGQNIGSTDGTGGSGFVGLIENVQGIEFLYVLDDGTQVLTPTAAQLDSIRSIVVTILVVSKTPDLKFTNSISYTSASGNTTWGAFDDNYRRRMLVSTIHCRNLGL